MIVLERDLQDDLYHSLKDREEIISFVYNRKNRWNLLETALKRDIK